MGSDSEGEMSHLEGQALPQDLSAGGHLAMICLMQLCRGSVSERAAFAGNGSPLDP